MFEGEEKPNIEEIHTAQHTHHMRSRGPITQSNPFVSNSKSTSSGNTQKKIVEEKAVTTNIIVNKNNPPVNKTASAELGFSRVDELQWT